MKNIVEDWIKTTGSKYKDTTEEIQKKNPDVEWQFLIGPSLHVTKMKSRNDRIILHNALNFDENFQNVIDTTKTEVNKVINHANEVMLLRELTWVWHKNGNNVSGIDVNTYVDEENLSRPIFFEKWDAVATTSGHVTRILGIALNPQQTTPTDSAESTSNPMYG